MITNAASGTNLHEIAPGIYRINTPVQIPGGLADAVDAAVRTALSRLIGPSGLIPVAGRCGIPSTAISVAANVTVVNPTATGSLSVFAGGPIISGTTEVPVTVGTMSQAAPWEETRMLEGLMSLWMMPARWMRAWTCSRWERSPTRCWPADGRSTPTA